MTPHVDTRLGPVRSDALDLAVLEKSEQQPLHPRAHLADFVHEDRAAVCLLEHAAAVADARR